MPPTIVTLQVCSEPLFLARMTVLLRKYDVEVRQIMRQPMADGREEITLTLLNKRDNLAVALSKLERLVAVVSLSKQSTKKI